MAAISGTGISLSTSYYLRNFYVSNRDARTASKRSEFSKGSLSKADADALHRACKKLRNFNYSEESTDGANIYSSVSAFLKTYNNALDSAKSSGDSSLERYSKYLKNLSNEYSDALEDIGITVAKDGSLSYNENLLKKADVTKVGKLFSSESEYLTKVSRYTKRMIAKSDDLIATEASEKEYANKKAQGTSTDASQTAVAALLAGSEILVGENETSATSFVGTNVDISL